jgi:DNA/RNA-binding domain of Phe-tRNA-synthetase-like protein
MLPITPTPSWQTAHPGAHIGLLELSGLDNTLPAPHLEQRKREIEARLRRDCAGFTRAEFLALPHMTAYNRYYRRFDKTYHVLLQVESIVLKGKNLPTVSPLVDANFAAEVDTFILAAGHDLSRLEPPVVIDLALPGDEMTQMSGQTRPIQPGDMIMRDRLGVCCTVLYGQDNRSPITPATQHALYVAYAPPGVPAAAVEGHLRRVEEHVRLFAPQAALRQLTLLAA